ncbi:MAG: cupin domain-containing protein [Hyphomicrobiales bacterium]
MAEKGMSAAEIIELLQLEPHPEGGHFRETWRADAGEGERAAGTAIYFLLAKGEKSAWHKVDAAEIWHWYAGAPMQLFISDGEGDISEKSLGPALETGARPQVIIPPHAWQSAASLGAWTLVGCTVSPGFEFEGFEMAPPGWAPGQR